MSKAREEEVVSQKEMLAARAAEAAVAANQEGHRPLRSRVT